MLSLTVEKRENESANASQLLRAGTLPCVVYGGQRESTPIICAAKEFGKVFDEAGEATIVMLSGLGEPLPTLIHQVDLDPITNLPRHVDFYAVTKGQKVEVNVPIEFVGESPAVKAGANLVKVLHEIEVEADPMSLPHRFTVDLSVLAEVYAQIHVRDIALPAGVTLVTPEDEVIVLTQEVVAEAVEETPKDIADVEVEEKGKKEEEASPTENTEA
ncbi:50S ribosomal protein L25 [Candidatus Kaiserbacteria bacterium CG10_big_fil_rev_8_21_14_0_10_56_12]|uniref:Large ribosomal subunit protein bL25 n=1 Tax=Candidatus Kaiserbacteria bacterium CG10_big_fil_rev_8_21_14_0_10_56_12 TaxID=1974611 RepID=A0A2H0UAQ9_9BACT|nr:MAG: 50S ribosomal protein L25 [Candidatus Kaiserbacteria bacterium CG10_big_fil_rev_8_21_14_0_10_56_12]